MLYFILQLYFIKNLRHGHGYKQGAGNAFPRVVGRKLTDLLSTCTRVAACRKYTGVGMGRREVRGKARRRKKSDIVARVRESLKGFGRNTTVARTLAKTRSEQESLTPSSDVMVSIGCMRAVMVLVGYILYCSGSFDELILFENELSLEVDQLITTYDFSHALIIIFSTYVRVTSRGCGSTHRWLQLQHCGRPSSKLEWKGLTIR